MNAHMLNNKGVALFIVLWVLILLTVIVGEFCYTMRTEVNITRNLKEKTQSYYYAVAGLNEALFRLLEKEYKAGVQKKADAGQWRINVDIGPITFSGGNYISRVDNESGKVNINRFDDSLFDMLFSHYGLERKEKYAIYDSILDWRDSDTLTYGNGAEDDYYFHLEDPYLCKDGSFDSVGEILYIKGVTPEMYHSGLKDVLTIYEKIDLSALERLNSILGYDEKEGFDYSKININAASRKMLLFFPGMTEKLADAVIDYRKEKDFVSIFELKNILGGEVYAKVARHLTLETTQYYTISSTGFSHSGNNNYTVKASVCLDYNGKKGYRMLSWYE